MISCRVPPFLLSIEDPRAAQGGSLKGCPVCGGTLFVLGLWYRWLMLLLGLGHGIANCPKLEDTQRRQMASHRGADDQGGY